MKRNFFLFAVFAVVFSPDRSVTAQWVQTNGPDGGYIECFVLSGMNLFVGTGYGGVFLTTNNGTNWISVNNGLTNSDVRALVLSGTNLFAGTPGGVFRSTDNGTSWTAVNTGLTNTEVCTLAVSGTNLFAGTRYGGVFLSTNNGSNWRVVNTGLPKNSFVPVLAVSETNLFAVFAGTDIGGVAKILRSNDNGASWTAAGSGLTNTNVDAFAVSGTNLFAGTDSGGVFLSTNNGTNWNAIGLTHTTVRAFAVSGMNLFAGTDGGGVFLSTDNGTSWKAVNTGLTDYYVHPLTMSGTNLFAGTYHSGVWRRPLSEMISGNAVEVIPSLDYSNSVRPNPFSQSTTISFSSPDRGFAQVTIVNLLGFEVGRIFAGELEAGEHSFTWDASRMLPGMYECVIRMNGQVEHVPMIVVR